MDAEERWERIERKTEFLVEAWAKAAASIEAGAERVDNELAILTRAALRHEQWLKEHDAGMDSLRRAMVALSATQDRLSAAQDRTDEQLRQTSAQIKETDARFRDFLAELRKSRNGHAQN